MPKVVVTIYKEEIDAHDEIDVLLDFVAKKLIEGGIDRAKNFEIRTDVTGNRIYTQGEDDD